uniref:BZIP transcription factor n=1 Tax=Chenopodium quinoa TaxID=63459 RepID=A0A803KSL9_CHEQI
MGSSNSKPEKTAALGMCKQRKRLINQAINSRYNLAAAHISYIQSLKNIGISLRRFAEAEVLIESSISLSPTHNTDQLDKTPSHSSSYHPSPSLSHDDVVEVCSSEPGLSCMKSGVVGGSGSVAVTLRYNPTSWDYFEPGDEKPRPEPEPESFRFVGLGCNGPESGVGGSIRLWGEEGSVGNLQKVEGGVSKIGGGDSNSGQKEKDLGEEREDPSEFITHRAKDFVSSIKDIEHRFFRASESGKEVARMFEANKIQVGYAEAKGGSSSSELLAACPLVFCRGKSVHDANDLQQQNVPKMIVWNRSTSSQSSSSRNPLASASKDDADDSGSECVEDFCMISGSHSSTLDRLYAWERKLYDEVKASEVIRKQYERKCDQLRHQFAKDVSTHVIDKTRAAVKDLHSRIRVALHAVDSIAKRIEKMRDEELQPQLTELITAFIRMWKAMLECHHAQYITISLAYHAKTAMGTLGSEAHKQIMAQLQYEFECFGLSFADWMNSLTSYVEAINGWLQNCVLQPQERGRGSRRPFSPRRVVAPPIFVLCRDWSAGIKALPSEEVSDAIKNFLSDLQQLIKQQQQAEEKKERAVSESNGELQEGKDEDANEGKSENLGSIHTSLTKVLDKLTKFSEASLKLYEDIRQKNEAARLAYLNPRPFRY